MRDIFGLSPMTFFCNKTPMDSQMTLFNMKNLPLNWSPSI